MVLVENRFWIWKLSLKECLCRRFYEKTQAYVHRSYIRVKENAVSYKRMRLSRFSDRPDITSFAVLVSAYFYGKLCDHDAFDYLKPK
jgi:hypothetical protein